MTVCHVLNDGATDFEENGRNNAGAIFASCAVEETSLVWLVSHMTENTAECWASVVEDL
jgi:hypothetical protein